MTNKRFENRLNKDNVKFNTLNPVWDNEKQDALNVFEMIDMLNHLHEENNELKLMLNSCSDQRDEFHRGARENANRVGKLEKENEQLKNKIDALEDDNETYHKSLEKLNLYTKRFIPTNCINEFKDCKTNRYYWLDHEGNFEGCLDLLNLLDCEREILESENRQLKAKLMEYEEQIKGDYE